MTATVYWGSTGRHINRNIHHHVGFTNQGGWFVWSDTTGEYDCFGSFGCEFIGGKFREPAPSIGYQRVSDVSFHMKAGFTVPLHDYVEICALHAEEATNRQGAGLRTQCWVGLGTDGKFRLLRGWTTGQPAGGTVVSTCPTAVTLDTNPGTSSDMWNNEFSSFLKRYIFRIVVHATNGVFEVWQEDGGGVLQKLHSESGLNTQGDGSVTDAITWTIGQRAPDEGVGSPIAPFPSSDIYYWRFQDVVVADKPIGLIRFHTLFANANGALQQFQTVDPNGGGTGPRYQLLRDDPNIDFSPSPDQDFTEVAQDGSSSSDTELVGFEDLPSLDTGETVVACGLSTYMSGSPGNNGTYGVDASARPEIRSGGTTVVAGTRVLYEQDDLTNFPDGYLDVGHVESMQGWFGWIPYQDWWGDFNGGALTDTIVNAMEGGVTTFTRACQLSQVTLLVVTAIELLACTGPPENPYPYDPPPTPGPVTNYVYQMRNDAWRKVIVQDGDLPPGSHIRVRGVTRQASQVGIMANTLWRYPSLETDQLPPPETEFPPYHDPCNLLPIVTPPVSVDPLGRRFWGISQLALSLMGMGELFTGTKQALGSWTPGDLARAASNGLTLITGQGPYKQYLYNNRFDLSYFIDQSVAKISTYLSTLAAAQTGGWYFGHSIADDFASSKLWPPSGISPSDMYDALNAIRAACPGIRLGVRGLTRQFPFNMGFDFYNAQFVSWRGQTATAFAVEEYGQALAWGSYICLDLNYLAGGNGSSGIRVFDGTMLSGKYMVSPAEVVSYLGDMYAAAEAIDGGTKLAGSVGYTYLPQLLSTPGMLAAMAAARNLMAAMTPLP